MVKSKFLSNLVLSALFILSVSAPAFAGSRNGSLIRQKASSQGGSAAASGATLPLPSGSTTYQSSGNQPKTFSLVIATMTGVGADFVGNTDVPFSQAIASLTANGSIGTIYVKAGNYIMRNQISTLTANMGMFLEDGAVFTNQFATQNVLSVNGTVWGGKLSPVGPWGGNFFIRIDSSGTWYNMNIHNAVLAANLGGLNSGNAPIVMTGAGTNPNSGGNTQGTGARIIGLNYSSSTMAGALAQKNLIYISSCVECSILMEGGRMIDDNGGGNASTFFKVENSTNITISGPGFIEGNILNYTFKTGSNLKFPVNVKLQDVVFTMNAAGDGGGVIPHDGFINGVMKNLSFIKNGAQGGTAIGSGGGGVSSGTYIADISVSNFATGINLNSQSNNAVIHGLNAANTATCISDAGSNTQIADTSCNGSLSVKGGGQNFSVLGGSITTQGTGSGYGINGFSLFHTTMTGIGSQSYGVFYGTISVLNGGSITWTPPLCAKTSVVPFGLSPYNDGALTSAFSLSFQPWFSTDTYVTIRNSAATDIQSGLVSVLCR